MAALAAILAAGGAAVPRAAAVTGSSPLAEPAAFWDVVLGTGYRATVDALDGPARDRVRERAVRRLEHRGTTQFTTNVVYGVATKPPG